MSGDWLAQKKDRLYEKIPFTVDYDGMLYIR